MHEPWLLLVEDTGDGVTLVRHALRKAGIGLEVVDARSGPEALALFAGPDARTPPSLVLLDLKMPGIDGLELLSRLRGEEPTGDVPVVVLTSSREPADVLAAYAAGANTYVRKPINFKDLIDVLGQVGAHWLDGAGVPSHPSIVPPSAAHGRDRRPGWGESTGRP